jgi:hypothetical protein
MPESRLERAIALDVPTAERLVSRWDSLPTLERAFSGASSEQALTREKRVGDPKVTARSSSRRVTVVSIRTLPDGLAI